jgi:hypothetical protein
MRTRINRGVSKSPNHQPQFNPKGYSMKPMLRYRSQLLFRRSLRPKRVLRIRPTKLNFVFRPARFGMKPRLVAQTVL